MFQNNRVVFYEVRNIMARIHLSEKFTYKKLLRFVAPTVISMAFASLYGIVDGFFISNFVGEVQFAALNLIYPLIMIFGALGLMINAGGNAIVSKELGEQNPEKANQTFSMLVYIALGVGIVFGVVGFVIARPIAEIFVKTEKSLSPEEKGKIVEYCVLYSRILFVALPAFMLQNVFQGFFITAEKARLGLCVTFVAGTGNMLLDALFILAFDWGLAGAAWATAINQCIGGIVPLVYFARKNNSLLRLGRTRFDGMVLAKVVYNGMSEFITNISASVVGMIYNAQLMKYIGINGVSAYGVVMYVCFLFISIFLGYSVGCSPIIGYKYGAKDREQLRSVLKKSLWIVVVLGVVMTGVCIVFAKPFCSVFVSSDQEVLSLSVYGTRLNAISFLICGVNIFASAFFTALSNGTVSLSISFSRMFFFQVGAVLILPIYFGQDGIWTAVIVAEVITVFMTIVFLFGQGKRYGYFRKYAGQVCDKS